MGHRIKSFLVSLVTGFLFTLLALATQAVIDKVYFHPFSIAITIVLWFFYSTLLWGGFFKDNLPGTTFLSPRLFKSFVVGLFAVLIIFGSMLLLGEMGGPRSLVISEVKNINAFGVVFVWILLAGLLFDRMFNPNKGLPK